MVESKGAPHGLLRDTGLSLLHEGDHPNADIVFVHGIQGHPQKTWSVGKGAGPYWPGEFLPRDFSDTSIWTFGYDSHISHWFSGPAMKAGITAHGESLLNSLVAHRSGCPSDRPLLFIVHSLGGLIVKEALRHARSSVDDEKRAIYDAALALIFFGTPHGGGNYVKIGEAARKIASYLGFDTSDKVLPDLDADSFLSKAVQEEFEKILDHKRPVIFTFQETLGLMKSGPFSGKVVDDSSSGLEYSRETRAHLHANYMEMCRFSDPDSADYKKVRDAVKTCLTTPRFNPEEAQVETDN